VTREKTKEKKKKELVTDELGRVYAFSRTEKGEGGAPAKCFGQKNQREAKRQKKKREKDEYSSLAQQTLKKKGGKGSKGAYVESPDG